MYTLTLLLCSSGSRLCKTSRYEAAIFRKPDEIHLCIAATSCQKESEHTGRRVANLEKIPWLSDDVKEEGPASNFGFPRAANDDLQRFIKVIEKLDHSR